MKTNELNAAVDFITEIKESLKTKNRFYCDTRFNDLVDFLVSDKVCAGNNGTVFSHVDAGKMLYRARIYKEPDAESRYETPPSGRFKGYDSKNSFVNLNVDNVGEGRCNPSHIPYLYTAMSEKCAIYEIQPTKGHYISVARIRVCTKLKILYLSENSYTADVHPAILRGTLNSTLIWLLAEEFRRPNKLAGEYILCQYVSESVKLKGFDGIAYRSSICPKPPKANSIENINIVVFDYNKCKPTSSKMYRINNVDIEYNNVRTDRTKPEIQRMMNR